MTIFSFLFFRYYLFLAILDIIILKNKKLLYMSTKDELTVSLSKSMTININQEEEIINQFIKNGNKLIKIIIYGKNSNDEKIYTKYSQLTSLGFYNVFLYTGGIFEWLLLQDIYGTTDFPTTKKELDLLRFKSNKVFGVHLLEY